MTLKEMIEIIKTENPVIQMGDDQSGYVELSKADYEATIKEWATIRLARLEAEKTQSLARSVLLTKLGITTDEAALLLS